MIAWLAGACGSAVAQDDDLIESIRAELEATSSESEERAALREQFALYTRCQPIAVVVVPPTDLETFGEIDLSWQEVTSTVNNRLKAARLHDDEAAQVLLVYLKIFGAFFSLDVRFSKELHDPITDLLGSADIWDSSAIGTHDNDRDYVLLKIYRQVDHFIAEYLRVNQCE